MDQRYEQLKSLILDSFYVVDTNDYLYDSMNQTYTDIKSKFWVEKQQPKTIELSVLKSIKPKIDIDDITTPAQLNYRNGKWINDQCN